MTSPVYAIDRWDELYECAQSRKITKELRWVTVTTSHDGKGYRRLIRLPNGPAMYAAWMLMLQVAAKCPQRGVLANHRGPLTAEDLYFKTDCPQDVFQEAFKALSDPSIGWLVVKKWEKVGESATGKEGNGKEDITGKKQPERESAGADPPLDVSAIFDDWNSFAELPRVREATPKRQSAARARLSQPAWRESWRLGLKKVSESSFCLGVNDRGWRANIDWFLAPDTLTKVLEGKYDDRSAKAKNARKSTAELFDFLKEKHDPK